MSLRLKVPPGLVWLGILIAVALLMSVILGFRIDNGYGVNCALIVLPRAIYPPQ